jgi:hypothetical protein
MFSNLRFSVLVLTIVTVFANGVFAGPSWLANPVDQAWNNGANWSSGSVPVAADSPDINTPDPAKCPIIAVGTDATFANCLVRASSMSVPALLKMTGGTLTSSAFLALGYGPGTFGYMSMSGGAATISNSLLLAGAYADGDGSVGQLDISGTAAMTATIIRLQDSYGRTGVKAGTINLMGGSLTTSDLRINNTNNYTPLINITGGILYWTGGNKTSLITTYVTNGWIKGYGGNAAIASEYESATNRTKVWAIEPQTLIYSKVLADCNFDTFDPCSLIGQGGWLGDANANAVVIADITAPSQANCARFVREASSKVVYFNFTPTIKGADALVNVSFYYKRVDPNSEIIFQMRDSSNSTGNAMIGISVSRWGFYLWDATAGTWALVSNRKVYGQWEQLLLQIDNITNTADLYLNGSSGNPIALLAKDFAVYEPSGDNKCTFSTVSSPGELGNIILLDNVAVVVGAAHFMADFNSDGKVDWHDFATFSDVWMMSTAP